MLRVTDIREDAGYGSPQSLFDGVRGFRFATRAGGYMTTRSLALGKATIAEVRGAGHDVALDPVSSNSFVMPQTGRIRVESARSVMETAGGGALAMRPGERRTAVRAAEGGEFRALVAIAPARRRVDEARAPGRAFDDVASTPEARALSGFLDYLLREAGLPGSPMLRPSALKAAESLVRDAMAALDRFDAPIRASEASGVSARRVKTAEAYMRAHLDAPLTVPDIAAAVGVGPRTLLAAFRERLDTTPRALLGELRLERARERLLAPAPGTSVTEAALDSGFAHLGRFAGAYRARYGESPSQTLNRALGEG